MFQTLYTIHASTWLILIITFFVTYFLKKKKISQTILRLMYLLMLGTGIAMVSLMGYPLTFVLKGILAFLLVSFMEMIIGRKKRQQKHTYLWGMFALVFICILLIGFNILSF